MVSPFYFQFYFQLLAAGGKDIDWTSSRAVQLSVDEL